MPIDMRANLRLAATHTARTCAAVTRDMYELGGGSSVFLSSPLQRRFRDAYVGIQHMMVAPQTHELTGRFSRDALFLLAARRASRAKPIFARKCVTCRRRRKDRFWSPTNTYRSTRVCAPG